jgi:flagellar motor protein MotB
LGEDEPVASNAEEAGRQRNRRVEVAIYASKELQEAARRKAGG